MDGPILNDPVSFTCLKDMMSAYERNVLTMALKHNNNNQRQTAKKLGINRKTLYSKIKKLGLE